MHITINGLHIQGVEKYVAKHLFHCSCKDCGHKIISHTLEGCRIAECLCKSASNAYKLFEDSEFWDILEKEVEFEVVQD